MIPGSVSPPLLLKHQSGFSATGGVITYSGGNTIHTFLSSSNLICIGSLPSGASCLIVGGGGSGAGADGVVVISYPTQ